MKILFVCLGNICRSPAAENVFRHLATQAGCLHDFVIDSAGTAGWHTGKRPDHRMCQTLESRNIPSTGAARQLSADDLNTFDLILAMDDENYANILKLDPSGQFHHKVKKFTAYCQNHPHKQVPDPYYGGQDGFDLVLDLLLDGCSNLLAQHRQS